MCIFAIMSCEEDPGKRVRGLRVVLTPLTSAECKVYVEQLQRRKAEQVKEAKHSVGLTPLTGEVCEACTDRLQKRKAEKCRRRERVKEWKKANPEKVREQKQKWREKNREKLRER
ncbi:MAG: hypothetical protein OIF58_16050, partial [Cohaesibacter sp.]|nr:hypothetical protein [Cohaesibacter sp.]